MRYSKNNGSKTHTFPGLWTPTGSEITAWFSGSEVCASFWGPGICAWLWVDETVCGASEAVSCTELLWVDSNAELVDDMLGAVFLLEAYGENTLKTGSRNLIRSSIPKICSTWISWTIISI